MPNQIALAALGLGLATLVVLGYRMWWQRRPGGLAFGPAVPRGQWRTVPPAAMLGVVLLAAVTGWFVPLLGASLLAFLAVDALLGVRARHRGDVAAEH